MSSISDHHWPSGARADTNEHVSRGVRTDLAFARLVFARGVSDLHLRAGAKKLYTATGDPPPKIEENDGVITITQGRRFLRSSGLDVALNESVPWEIEVRGGASSVVAELEPLSLRSFDITGGMSAVELRLGRPSGACGVRVKGGASQISIRRPHGIGVRVALAGGASELSLDRFHFGAVGGTVRWESQEYRNAIDRYEIEIKGGASEIRIGHLGED
jgi:hypothetical protein